MLRFCLFLPVLCFAGSWSQEKLTKMNLKEKVGQLFVAPAAPLREDDHWQDWKNLLQNVTIQIPPPPTGHLNKRSCQ